MADGALSRTEEITQILRDEILRGQYRPGERLPSERDLTARFETSRGTVREAFKKLEQLGITTIQPGGARVVPIQECTLDVLGPLLELREVPDAGLLDQVLSVGSVLISYAAELAVAAGDPEQLARVEAVVDEVLATEPEHLREMHVPRRLGRLFAEASGNLVLLLIINGLRTQIPEPKRTLGFPPKLDPAALKRIATELKTAVSERDAMSAGASMTELMGLIRFAVRDRLTDRASQVREATS